MGHTKCWRGLAAEDPRLRIHSNTVAMSENMDEIWKLTEYLHDHCPPSSITICHHPGDRKNPSLQDPHWIGTKTL